MTRYRRWAWLFVLSAPLLAAACGEDQTAEAPPAHEITRDAVGYYCNMIVADHPGPKAQIFVAGREPPYWFSSVRDAIAFTLLPEEPRDIALYVNDMGRATHWDSPEPGTWIDARDAWYVLESSRRGGMGAPEAVPFSDPSAAHDFVMDYGGRVVAFADIPAPYILGEVDETDAPRDDSERHREEVSRSDDHANHAAPRH